MAGPFVCQSATGAVCPGSACKWNEEVIGILSQYHRPRLVLQALVAERPVALPPDLIRRADMELILELPFVEVLGSNTAS